MTIGERIKSIRELSGKNQRDFAASIKISQPTLAMFENGQREPKDIHIEQICIKHGINEEWLRTGEGKMSREVEDDVAEAVSDLLEENSPLNGLIVNILNAYRKMDDKSQKALNSLIQELMDNMKKGD